MSANTAERWGVFEVTVTGPEEGNPFTEREFSGVFRGKNEEKLVSGFYDGGGVYRVRFMPSLRGNTPTRPPAISREPRPPAALQ